MTQESSSCECLQQEGITNWLVIALPHQLETQLGLSMMLWHQASRSCIWLPCPGKPLPRQCCGQKKVGFPTSVGYAFFFQSLSSHGWLSTPVGISTIFWPWAQIQMFVGWLLEMCWSFFLNVCWFNPAKCCLMLDVYPPILLISISIEKICSSTSIVHVSCTPWFCWSNLDVYGLNAMLVVPIHQP